MGRLHAVSVNFDLTGFTGFTGQAPCFEKAHCPQPFVQSVFFRFSHAQIYRLFKLCPKNAFFVSGNNTNNNCMKVELREKVEKAWEDRAMLSYPDVIEAIEATIDLIEQGAMRVAEPRSEEHTSELQSLMRIS